MLRWQPLAAIAVVWAIASASAVADGAVPQRSVIMATAVAHRASFRPFTNYIGTVSTLPNFSGEASEAVFDTVDGDFFLVEGEYLNQLLPNGQTTQITNFFSWGFPAAIVWDANTQLFYATDGYDVISVTPQGAINLLAGSGFPGTSDGQGETPAFKRPAA
jgi:hypothetical protein